MLAIDRRKKSENRLGGMAMGLRGKLLPGAVILAAFVCLSHFLASGIEWRLPAMAGLAFGLSLYKIEIKKRDESQSISLPLWHGALFAGSVTLGWFGATLSGAIYGFAKLIFSDSEAKPSAHSLFAALKPAMASVLVALAYAATGGDVLRPQAVDAIFPILAAGVIYAAFNVVLKDESLCGEDQAVRWNPQLIAPWSISLLAGYCMAVLNTVAPVYVLLAPCLALGAAMLALCHPEKQAEAVEEPVIEQTAASVVVDDSLYIDPDTGLANGKYLDMFLKREINRAERNGGPVSVAVFDLDDLKQFIENYGKGFIHEALGVIGQRLKNSVRDYDLVVRHSPRRVLVVLPEAGAEEAYDVINRLHEFVTAEPYNGLNLSTSVGIATYPDHASTQEELIQACHRALNQGRFTGPNQVYGLQRLEETG